MKSLAFLRPSRAPALRAALAIAVMAAMAASPAAAARQAKAPAKPRFTTETVVPQFQPPVTASAPFSFTASGNSAATARMQTVERAFRFTPSGQNDRNKGLSLGVSTRVVASAADRSKAGVPTDPARTAPAAYNVDLSLGWRGFAVSTGFAHTEPNPAAPPVLTNRLTDAVNLGLSYGGRNWRTKLQGTAEQGTTLAFAPIERRYSVELGGSYLVAPRLSVTGGVRYRLAPTQPSLLDPNRDDQAVYVGTNIAF